MEMPLQSSGLDKTWLQQLGREFSRSLVNNAHLGAYLEPLLQSIRPYWTAIGHRARVVGLRDESAEIFTLVLEPMDGWAGFQAGQFVELSIDLDGRRLSRCFSICSSPSYFEQTGRIELTIRIQDQGRVTPKLRSDLRVGKFIGISKAKGDFLLRQGDRPLLLIAGGSGITPFRSMLEEMSHQTIAPDTTLLYYCRTEDAHLFQAVFDSVANKHSNIRIVCIATSTQGRFHSGHLTEYCEDFQNRDIYLCGPGGLIALAQSTLTELGVSSEQIHLEHFGPAPVEVGTIAADGRVLFSRSSTTVEADSEKPESILTMAEENGLRPNSGCRMGVCGQCRCTKTSGVVYNTRTGLHSDTGTETIQLCVSVPIGDVTIQL